MLLSLSSNDLLYIRVDFPRVDIPVFNKVTNEPGAEISLAQFQRPQGDALQHQRGFSGPAPMHGQLPRSHLIVMRIPAGSRRNAAF